MTFDYQNFSTAQIENLNPGLYIVSTPIGNIEDITIRAIKILRSVDYIICEHHEITKKLLRHYDIKANILHYNDDMPDRHLHKIYDIIDRSKKIALVSDAGTPSISDPGYCIIKYLINRDKKTDLFSAPGPTSFVAALTLSGFPCNNFYFYGFLPRTEAKSSSILYKLLNIQSLLIFFESPHRLLNTLNLIYKIFGNIEISVSKEITKLFEETFRGSISSIIEELEKKDSIKGEYIIIVNNIEKNNKITEENQNSMIEIIKLGVKNKESTKDILQKLIEQDLTNNMNKKELYKLILEKSKQ
jgi:16S rRNA (cytidine1402-2'-O)-methyltransferase